MSSILGSNIFCKPSIPPPELGLTKISELNTTIISLAIYTCPALQNKETLYATAICCGQAIETTFSHNKDSTVQEITTEVIKYLLDCYINKAVAEREEYKQLMGRNYVGPN